MERAFMGRDGGPVPCGSHWLALNARAWAKEEDEGIRDLLKYVENGEVAEGDALMRDIDEAVNEANHDERWVSDVFSVSTIQEDALRTERIRSRAAAREAREEGLAEGKAEGLAEGEAREAARYNRLVKRLAAEGRLEELARAADDPVLMQALFSEFQLS